MIKRFLFLLIVAASVTYAAESAANLASHFAGRPRSKQTMADLPAGREQEVLAALVARQSVYLDVLLRLNHAPTVERVMGEFVESKGKNPYLRGRIEASGSPYIIDELAPSLYKNDRIQPRLYGEGTVDYGESAQAAEIIGQLIIKAPEFPPEVKAWAKKHLGRPGRDIIQAGRAWWELNQATLLANQFDKVQVPTSYPAGVPSAQPAQLATPPATIEPTPATESLAPPPEPTPEPVKSAVATSPPTPTAEQVPAKDSNPVWWILGSIILAGGAVLVLRTKKPKA